MFPGNIVYIVGFVGWHFSLQPACTQRWQKLTACKKRKWRFL